MDQIAAISLFIPPDQFVLLNDIKNFLDVKEPEDAAACAVATYSLCGQACSTGISIRLYSKWMKLWESVGKGEDPNLFRELIVNMDAFSETTLLGCNLSSAYTLEFRVSQKILEFGYGLMGGPDDFGLFCNALKFYSDYVTFNRQGFHIPVSKCCGGSTAGGKALAYGLFPKMRDGKRLVLA